MCLPLFLVCFLFGSLSGKFGSSGCRQRFHMPVESDPDYSAALLEKTLYFNEKISEADAKLAVRNCSEIVCEEVHACILGKCMAFFCVET